MTTRPTPDERRAVGAFGAGAAGSGGANMGRPQAAGSGAAGGAAKVGMNGSVGDVGPDRGRGRLDGHLPVRPPLRRVRGRGLGIVHAGFLRPGAPTPVGANEHGLSGHHARRSCLRVW